MEGAGGGGGCDGCCDARGKLAYAAGGGTLTVPSPKTCEHAALQFDNIRGLNETAWAAELRMLDGTDSSFRD